MSVMVNSSGFSLASPFETEWVKRVPYGGVPAKMLQNEEEIVPLYFSRDGASARNEHDL
jgi:hypothetical protein